MPPYKRFNPEEAKERRCKRTQRRKRKIGAIKKAHGLKNAHPQDSWGYIVQSGHRKYITNRGSAPKTRGNDRHNPFSSCMALLSSNELGIEEAF